MISAIAGRTLPSVWMYDKGVVKPEKKTVQFSVFLRTGQFPETKCNYALAIFTFSTPLYWMPYVAAGYSTLIVPAPCMADFLW